MFSVFLVSRFLAWYLGATTCYLDLPPSFEICKAMQLVLFDEAMQHLMKINRGLDGSGATLARDVGFLLFLLVSHGVLQGSSGMDTV